MSRRLAIVASHPIQYHAPWFRHLASQPELEVRVFYLWDADQMARTDPGFARVVRWDIPLLDGYAHELVPNTAVDPGTHHLRGLRNPSLFRRLEAWSPDAVLLLTCHYESVYRLLMRWDSHRGPLLFRGDSHRLVSRGAFRESLSRIWLRAVYSRIDAFLYVGSANREYFLHHGAPENRLYYAPYAVDVERFTPKPELEAAGRAWRAELGIPASDRVVMFVGKFEEKKRVQDLLSAFSRSSAVGATLLLVGSGPQEAALVAAAEGMSKVRFAPFQNQSAMPHAYAAADVVVLPSVGPEETWGLVIQEAMQMGRAVIASSHVGCVSDLVVQGHNGLVYTAGDVDALANALREALADPQRLREWGEAGRSIAVACDYDRMTDGLLSALDAVGRDVASRRAKGGLP